MDLKETNQKIENKVVGRYKKVEESVIDGYKKMEETIVCKYNDIEDRFVGQFLTKDGESIKEAKERIRTEMKSR